MPTYGTGIGVYTAGEVGSVLQADEVSSTYEGRHLTFLASEINHGDVLSVVTKGYPVIVGEDIVGVAFNTEVAGSDYIAVDTEGIWMLSVEATDYQGDVAVVAGDRLYINHTTAVISKNNTVGTHIPFGYALGGVTTGETAIIAVKVHWDPQFDPIQMEQEGTGLGKPNLALNNIRIVNTGVTTDDTRGLQINMTSGGDGQIMAGTECFRAYITLVAGDEIAAAAGYVGFYSFLDFPDDLTIGASALLVGFRSVIYAHNNDLSAIAGGGESALFYGQTWGIGTGTIDHGLAIVAGAGTTIANCIHAVGTFTRLMDFSEAGDADANINIATWPTREATGRIVQWYMGDLATRATIRAFTGDLISEGSMYFSSTGEIFMKVASATADTDWEVLNHEAADAG